MGHCVEMIMKCLNVICHMCIPFYLYVYDATCVCKGDVLAKDFSRVLNE